MTESRRGGTGLGKKEMVIKSCLPCLCHPVPFKAAFNSSKWVRLRTNTHCFKSSSKDRLEAERLTFDPSGSGGLCVVVKGLLFCVGSTEMTSLGQEAAKQVMCLCACGGKCVHPNNFNVPNHTERETGVITVMKGLPRGGLKSVPPPPSQHTDMVWF